MLIGLAHGDLRGLRSQLAAMGASAVLALIVLVLAHTVLPFPAEPLEAAAGFALGFAVALPVLLASFLASAILAYAIGAWIGRPLAGALVGSTRLQSAERLVARGGARGLFAMRLFPLVPFSPLWRGLRRDASADAPLRMDDRARDAPVDGPRDVRRGAASILPPHRSGRLGVARRRPAVGDRGSRPSPSLEAPLLG